MFVSSRLMWLVMLGLAGVTGSSGCQPPPQALTPAPPPLITVARPLQQTVIDYDEYTGRVDAVATVEVRPRVSGYLKEIHFRDGALVKAGDKLFTIDPAPYEADVKQATGDQERLVARVERLSRDFERFSKLLPEKVISRQEYEKTAGDLAEAKAELLSAQARVDRAKLDLGYTVIKAELSGRVGKHSVSVGNLILANETTPLTSIVSMTPMHVYVDCPERAMLKYQELVRTGALPSARKARLPMFIGLENETATPHEGVIDFIDNAVNPRTGTIRARGEFKNDPDYLTPGLFCRVRVPGSGRYEALLVPERSLGSDQGQPYLLVVGDKNKLETRPVKTGSVQGDMRVVLSGLTSQDRFVMAGAGRVRPGMTIDPQDVALEPPPVLPLPAMTPDAAANPPGTASPPMETLPTPGAAASSAGAEGTTSPAATTTEGSPSTTAGAAVTTQPAR